jgi:hypothetical protein
LRKVKDKEGVIFEVVLCPKIKSKSRKRDSVIFVKNIIDEKLKSMNVYPENNKIGLHGDINQISYFIGGLIDTYHLENQLCIINNI